MLCVDFYAANGCHPMFTLTPHPSALRLTPSPQGEGLFRHLFFLKLLTLPLKGEVAEQREAGGV